MERDAERDVRRLEGRLPPDAIGPIYGRTPRGRAPAPPGSAGGRARGAKATALKNETDAAWTDFDTDGFISHVTANPCDLDGGNVDTEVTLYLKATEDPANAPMGYETLAAGDFVGWMPGDGTEDVPGTDPVVQFDGYLIPNAGAGGAAMTARVVD